MRIFYSSNIDALINSEKHLILIPDLILIKEGIACGDRLIIKGQVDNTTLRFDIVSSSSCILCKAVSIDLVNSFNNMEIDDVYSAVQELLSSFSDNITLLYSRYGLCVSDYGSRRDCMLAPYKLLVSLIEQLRSENKIFSEVPNTLDSMECDACVSSCEINWTNKKRKRMDHRGDRRYDREYLRKWLPLGKIELIDEDITLLKEMCKSASEEDLQFLSDYTMNSIVLKHLMKYAPEMVDEKWKKAAYLIQKNEINKTYVETIRKFILEDQLQIYFVKGYISQKYYANPALRIHSDYDVIATNCLDAFRLANYLMNNGFSIRPNLFSYKPILQDNMEKISGHFHLQRIIDDTYLLEFDISFPGFPLNRIQLYYPKFEGGDISTEDQVIITLLHLFKHSNVFMKDINDLFYMLQTEMDYDYLFDRIEIYHLNIYFKVVLRYIINNYPHAKERINPVFLNLCDELSEEYANWPYDEDEHKRLKVDDYQQRLAQGGEVERIYLYPVIIFKTLYDMSGTQKLKEEGFALKIINEGIIQCKYANCELYLTSIGILINSFIDTNEVTRIEYIEVIERIMNMLNFEACAFQDVPFATEHFYVRDI